MKLKHVKLFCAQLDQLKYFYGEKFNFPVEEQGREEVSFRLGDSKLTFIETRLNNPYYHFAFNIPYYQVEDALQWAKKRVDILTYQKKEVQEFPEWKARAFYFRDPSGNIVEFIGRERLEGQGREPFSEKSIWNISEIGLPVFQVSSAVKMLQENTDVPQFDCSDNVFCACGDDEGLFIVVDKAEKQWFPTAEPARSFPLTVHFSQGENDYHLELRPGDSFQISKAGEND